MIFFLSLKIITPKPSNNATFAVEYDENNYITICSNKDEGNRCEYEYVNA